MTLHCKNRKLKEISNKTAIIAVYKQAQWKEKLMVDLFSKWS